MILYDHKDTFATATSPPKPRWIPSFIFSIKEVKQFLDQAFNVLRHVQYQANGRGSGVHGLFHQYVPSA